MSDVFCLLVIISSVPVKQLILFTIILLKFLSRLIDLKVDEKYLGYFNAILYFLYFYI